MGSKIDPAKCGTIAASCTLGRKTFPVAISELSCNGCHVEADSDWPADCDFLHLSILGDVEVNGCAARQDGHGADIRFFGEIHPLVVNRLAAAA